MIKLKTSQEIELMGEGGKILAGVVSALAKQTVPGITTLELEKAAEALILGAGAECSFKGYEGFPSCLCASVNEVIVHSVPSERKLKEGDIISLDLGVYYKGFHTDMAVSLGVGKISEQAQKLIEATRESLEAGISAVKSGNHFGDIGYAVQKYIGSTEYGIIRGLCGHGIGRQVHEDPKILNYGEKGITPEIKEGMVFCIEPMISMGDWKLKRSKDGFGYEMKDGSLAAHFEHTIAVTKDGVKVLTKLE